MNDSIINTAQEITGKIGAAGAAFALVFVLADAWVGGTEERVAAAARVANLALSSYADALDTTNRLQTEMRKCEKSRQRISLNRDRILILEKRVFMEGGFDGHRGPGK